MIKKIDHFVLTTANLPDCIIFYGKLGFQARNVGDRWELLAGDFKINLHRKGLELEPKAKHVQTGSADLCFEIEGSIFELKNSLLEKGLKFELDIVPRHGARGKMNSLYLRDPEGNLVELCSYE
ncbi:MAG: VOC family protein [Clostridia bacterium]